jgi:hypothetical protein
MPKYLKPHIGCVVDFVDSGAKHRGIVLGFVEPAVLGIGVLGIPALFLRPVGEVIPVKDSAKVINALRD